jgi:chromosome partitioning protein
MSDGRPHHLNTSEAIRPRRLQHIKAEFAKHSIPAFTVHMHEREAFRAISSFGGTLESLNPKMGTIVTVR